LPAPFIRIEPEKRKNQINQKDKRAGAFSLDLSALSIEPISLPVRDEEKEWFLKIQKA